MKSLPYSVDRNILIEADRDTVFGFFTDSARWATWWGAGSTVDFAARWGAADSTLQRLRIGRRGSGSGCARTICVHVQSPGRAAGAGGRIPRGPSTWISKETGTLLRLTHEVADAKTRDLLVQGWRFHFSLFANAVANYVNAGAPDVVDAWFAMWTEPDASAREAILGRIATRKLRFATATAGWMELMRWWPTPAQRQRFMPGIGLERKGTIRHCQGTVLADWIARASDGQEKMSGTSVFLLGPGLKIDSVTSVSNVTS